MTLLLLVLVAVGPAETKASDCPPRPKSKATARALARRWYKRAVTLYRAGRIQEAHRAFRCTQAILPAGLTAYWLGRTAQELERWKEATAIFEKLVERPPEPVTREEIRRRLEVVRARMRREAARRRPVPRAAVRATGRRAAASVSGVRIGSWTLVGLSGLLLATAAATGGVLLADERALEGASDGTWWSPGLSERYDRRTPLLVTTWVSLGVGLLSAAAATALFLLDRNRPSPRPGRPLAWRF